MFGVIGGPLAFLGDIGVLLGACDNPSGPLSALTVLEVIWEFSLSVWLIFRGFRPSPILTGPPVNPEPGKLTAAIWLGAAQVRIFDGKTQA
jgi:hypothetical protein